MTMMNYIFVLFVVSDGLCTPSFVEKAKTQECALPYSKMIQSMEEKDKCKYVVHLKQKVPSIICSRRRRKICCLLQS